MGCLKAALPFAGRTVIKRQIDALQTAGCDQIIVVTGYEAKTVASLAEKHALQGQREGPSYAKAEAGRRADAAVKLVYHADYAQGMFTSIQAGAAALEEDVSGFVVLPVDCVRVSPRVIHQVMQAGMEAEAQALQAGSEAGSQALQAEASAGNQVILPCFNGETGHPPWFAASWKEKILQSEGPLDALICWAGEEGLVRRIETDSPAILWDMDTQADYEYMLAHESNLPFVIWEDLLREQELPERTAAHCRGVGRLAWEWAAAVNRRHPGRMDERLAYTGGLLHDMAKKHPDHEKEGARILRWHGYDRLAEIVEVHMGLPGWDGVSITEKELVYAADKVVQETTRVSVQERYRPAKQMYENDPDILARIEAGERKASQVIEKVFQLMSQPNV